MGFDILDCVRCTTSTGSYDDTKNHYSVCLKCLDKIGGRLDHIRSSNGGTCVFCNYTINILKIRLCNECYDYYHKKLNGNADLCEICRCSCDNFIPICCDCYSYKSEYFYVDGVRYINDDTDCRLCCDSVWSIFCVNICDNCIKSHKVIKS